MNKECIPSSILRGIFLIRKTNLSKTHLVLDGGVDLVESGDASQLLSDLLVICSVLGMLTELILEELEVISPLLDLLGKGVLKGGDVLRVVHLKMKVDARM